ncbi:high mobility group B protein 7-like [Diaphorina citri]|uniref:High mobility group B protein 7-like n=1 Tax=Diaphorina citri TaxID=121845 RepID=A0A1S3CUS1_DIACI|nr:high mobility group B protein 7-like [Diaphorina citri]KAI5709487.1 hypothetical protein M8J75_000592 [Diaphorina citri]KAI5744642.1 hypothetical protein M8J76_004001 [Diaphorina citri]KAI5751572.1 hypothetical protein M8J77_008766 [Diaphorina citri]
MKYNRNPYINFYVQLIRQDEYKGQPASSVAKQAGEIWNSMTEQEKECYYQMAENASRSRGSKKLMNVKVKRETEMKSEYSDDVNTDGYESYEMGEKHSKGKRLSKADKRKRSAKKRFLFSSDESSSSLHSRARKMAKRERKESRKKAC